MKNPHPLQKEPRFTLFERLADADARGGLIHLSSELAFYGITSSEEIRAAVEGCIRIFRNASGDPERHFRSAFAHTPQGLRQVWMVSGEGWELLLTRIAPCSPQLSQKLLLRIKSRISR